MSLFLSENNAKISDVCTKYQEACRIVNLALTGIISQCVPGAKIFDLCQFGTSLINTEASKLYTKKINGNLLERGVAFPVCISVNENVCNISPLASDEMVSEENAALLCFC
jgi:methionine aminopeptidase